MITVEKYLELFEQNIIIAGVKNNTLRCSQVFVPIGNGKLDKTQFGSFLGNRFAHDKPLVIDYYGLLKKSDGFVAKCESYEDLEIRRMRSSVIHFASIKIEDIVALDKNLAVDFPGFKKYLVDLREFQNQDAKKVK